MRFAGYRKRRVGAAPALLLSAAQWRPAIGRSGVGRALGRHKTAQSAILCEFFALFVTCAAVRMDMAQQRLSPALRAGAGAGARHSRAKLSLTKASAQVALAPFVVRPLPAGRSSRLPIAQLSAPVRPSRRRAANRTSTPS